MSGISQAQRQAERHVRLLCSLGMDWRLLMPDLTKALREVVPIPMLNFGWQNSQLQTEMLYIDWNVPHSDEIAQRLFGEYYLKNRMLEIFKSAEDLAKLPNIVTNEQMLRISKREFERHDFYQSVYQPLQTHHNLCLRLGYENGMLATLLINRPQGEPDFSRSELQALNRLIPFLFNAVNHHQSHASPHRWSDGEPGLIVFDRSGHVDYMDHIAQRLLGYALERRQSVRNYQSWLFPEAPLKQVLSTLAGQLQAIRRGNTHAVPALVKQRNHWGTFEFKGRWLEAHFPGEGHLFAASVQRKIPMPIKIALNLKAYGLSPRTAEVAVRLAMGDTYQQIATRLAISEHTAISHARQIFAQLEVENRADLLAALLREV